MDVLCVNVDLDLSVINMLLILMLGMEAGRRVVQKMGNPCDGREFYSKQIGVIDPRWSNILNQRLLPHFNVHHIIFFTSN